MDTLEAELDRLFQLLPSEFVAARKLLADQLKKAGDREAATRVLAMKRAAPSAWAINQVHFREPELLQRALARAQQLQALQATDGADPKQLSAAIDAQRAATQAIVDAATRHCESAGINAAQPQQRKIFTTVQGWLAGTSDEAPGRMTRELEPSGFDAIGSVGLVLPFVAPPVAGPHTGAANNLTRAGAARAAASPELDTRAIDRATEELARCEREARRALEEARTRDAERKRAEREFEHAKLQVSDAERALTHLRATLAQRETEQTRARTAATEALAVQRRAETAVGDARTELARLRAPR